MHFKNYHPPKNESLLNRMGYVVTWVAWVCGLRRSNIYVGYVGQNIFYVGHHFYVGCAGQIYFCVGQTFLRGSKTFCLGLFVGQNILCGSNNFCLGQFLEASLK